MEQHDLAQRLKRHATESNIQDVITLCDAVLEADQIPASNTPILEAAKACLPRGLMGRYLLAETGAYWLGLSCLDAKWVDRKAALACASEDIARLGQ